MCLHGCANFDAELSLTTIKCNIIIVGLFLSRVRPDFRCRDVVNDVR